MKRFWWVWIIIVGLAVWLGQRSSALPEVTTADATNETIERTVLASGELIVADDQKVFAPLAGTVETVLVAEGETVKKGQALVSYDPTSLYTALKAAESQLVTAEQAKAALADANLTDAKRAALQAAVDQATSDRDRAQKTYNDNKTDANAATLDAAATAYRTAVANQEAAINAQPKAGDYNKLTAAVDAAQAALWDAQKNSNKRTITASADGVVAYSRDTAGNILSAGQTTMAGQLVATIVTPDTLRFKAQIDETDLAAVKAGQAARVNFDAYPGDEFTGKVTKLSVVPELSAAGSKVYAVTAQLDKPNDTMRVGMQGQISFVVDTAKDVLAIPSEAVITSGKKNEVVVLENDTAKRKEVGVGVESTTKIQITSGLKSGDKIVTSANARDLKDGQKVKLK